MSTSQHETVGIKIFSRPRPVSTLNDKTVGHLQMGHTAKDNKLFVSMFHKKKYYTFEHAFGEESTNVEVYDKVVAPLVLDVLQGFNCTVFPYGQSESGKTHTMFGDLKVLLEAPLSKTSDDTYGLIPRVAQQIFSELSKSSTQIEYSVRLSFIEIVAEEVFDLLDDGNQLRVYDDPLNKGDFCIKDMRKLTICDFQDFFHLLKLGLLQHKKHMIMNHYKSTFGTLIAAFHVVSREIHSKGKEISKTGQLFLLDTPSSDKFEADTKDFLYRGPVAMKNVMKALSLKSPHAPYGDSKLTRILKNTFGGNCRTVMITTYICTFTNWNETAADLDFANNTKAIMNTPCINTLRDVGDIYQEIDEEVKRLKIELTEIRSDDWFYVTKESCTEMKDEGDQNNAKIMKLVKKITELEEFEQIQENEYRALERSFADSQGFPELAKMLGVKREEVFKGTSEKIAKLANLQKQMQERLTALTGACDASTSREALCHEKLQAKSNIDQVNIEIANHIVTEALACLHTAERACIYTEADTDALIVTVELFTDKFLDETLASLEEVDKIVEGMLNYRQKPPSEYVDVPRLQDICKKLIGLPRNCATYPERVLAPALRSIAWEFDKECSAYNAELDEAEQRLDLIHRRREAERDSKVAIIGDLLKASEEARSDLLEKAAKCAQETAAEKALLAASEAEEAELMLPSEFAGLKLPEYPTLDGSSIMRDHEIFVNKAKQAFTEFDSAVARLSQETEDTKQKILQLKEENTRKMMQMCCDSAAQKMEEKLKEHESVYEREVAGLEKQLEVVKRKEHEELLQLMGAELESLADIYKTKVEVVQEKVESTIQEIEELHGKIDATGHAGDSPTKEN